MTREAGVPASLPGTVILSGKITAFTGYNLTVPSDQVYYGRISDGGGSRLFQPLDVGDSGVFRQVVVYIESISMRRPFLEATSPRFYADQMVENPYIRCTITEGVQRAIVPTLGKKRYR
jgi:hypothetical protein